MPTTYFPIGPRLTGEVDFDRHKDVSVNIVNKESSHIWIKLSELKDLVRFLEQETEQQLTEGYNVKEKL